MELSDLLRYPDHTAMAARLALAVGDYHLALAHGRELERMHDPRGPGIVGEAKRAIQPQKMPA